MKKLFVIASAMALILSCASCSRKISASHINGWVSSRTSIVSYNELTMDLDTEPIQYSIDITTESGRAKLKGLSLEEAMDLVLVEAIIANKCATIFEPKYKHTVQNGKVLGILIYGHPARYKNKQ